MLTELNEEQRKVMIETKDEFISLLNKELDEKEAREGVKFVYGLAKLKEPKVVILSSPIGCQLFLNVMKKVSEVGSKVRSEVESKVRSKVWDEVWFKVRSEVRDEVGNEVGSEVESEVRSEVGSKVRSEVESKVRSEVESKVRSKVRFKLRSEYHETSYDGLYAADWVSFYSFFMKIGILENKKFDVYEKYIKSGVFSSVYTENYAVLSKNPTFISRDEKGRLHCLHDYAIAWADGYGQHYVNGVYFPLDLFNKIFKGNPTGKDILMIKNTEQKAVAIQHIGYDKILKDINAIKLDSWVAKGGVDGKPKVAELFEFSLDGATVRVVKVQDHSVDKITFLGVPVSEQTKTAKGAIAWTFGIEDESKYNPEIES